MSNYLPVNNALEPFWSKDGHELSDYRSTASLPTQSDIVIVGAGYAGVTTAYHLLKDGIGEFSVTILEARGACSGATGRNGGHLRPDLYGHIPTYIARAGIEAGAEVAKFEVQNLWAIKKIIEDEQIDCDFTLTRSIDVWCNDDAAQQAKVTYDRMAALKLDFMKDVFFTSDPKVAEGVSGGPNSECTCTDRDSRSSILESRGPRLPLLTQPVQCGHTNSFSDFLRSC